MSEQKVIQYTLEDLLGAAQGNWNGLTFTLIAYLKDHNLSPVDLWHYIGGRFAEFWSKDSDALAVAEGSAINWASIGVKVVEVSGDARRATFIMSGWPPQNILQQYDLTREEVDDTLEIMRPIASSLGCDYEWKREGERVIQVFTKK